MIKGGKPRFVAGARIIESPRTLADLKEITTATVAFHGTAWQRKKHPGEPAHTFVHVEAADVSGHTAGSLEIDLLRTDHFINAAAHQAKDAKSVFRVDEPTLMLAMGRLPFCEAWLRYLGHLAVEPADWHERLLRELESSEPGRAVWFDSSIDAVKCS